MQSFCDAAIQLGKNYGRGKKKAKQDLYCSVPAFPFILNIVYPYTSQPTFYSPCNEQYIEQQYLSNTSGRSQQYIYTYAKEDAKEAS